VRRAMHNPTADEMRCLHGFFAALDWWRLAPRPELAWTRRAVRGFARAFEAWYQDRFGGREALVHAYNYGRFFWFHASPTPRVLRGREGWLFVGFDEELATFQRATGFTAAERAAWRRRLGLLKAWSERVGAPLVFVVAPNKSTVYPGFMPAHCCPRPARLRGLGS